MEAQESWVRAATVVLAQETRTLECDIPAARKALLKEGWCSFLVPAEPGKVTSSGRRYASGGVGVLWRPHLTLSFPPAALRSSRAAAATLHFRSLGDITFVSVYGISAAGWAGNGEMFQDIFQASGGPSARIVWGGDWNVEPVEWLPEDIARKGWTIVAPALPTVTPGEGRPRTLDYFVVSNPLLGLVGQVKVVGDSGIRTHSPVAMKFRIRDTVDKLWVLRRPDPGEADPAYGPSPEGEWPECEKMEEATSHIWGSTMSLSSSEVQPHHRTAVEDYWQKWCQEVDGVRAAIFGGDPPKPGRTYGRCSETELARRSPLTPPLKRAWHQAALWWRRRVAEALQALRHGLRAQAKAVFRVIREACSKGGAPKEEEGTEQVREQLEHGLAPDE
jgi:hypothetical protein